MGSCSYNLTGLICLAVNLMLQESRVSVEMDPSQQKVVSNEVCSLLIVSL